jgi:cell division protein FtsZ
MSINFNNYFDLELPKEQSSIIKVFGVGGGGSNAVTYMNNKGISGVDFYICNTDAQHLERSSVPNKIQLGSKLTEGLGAGGDPAFGKQCALESIEQIENALRHNTKMVFITAGMGGGTGTGAAPVIAQKARSMGILTVAIVTRPFTNEGPEKTKKAELGIAEIKPHVDAILVINNQRILQMFSNLRITEALGKADDVLYIAAKGIAEIITKEGFFNVDFRDVKTALEGSGRAIMGIGSSMGDDRALKAAQIALESPLLDENSIEGAKHILLNISYGNEEPYTAEVDAILAYFQNQAGQRANLKYGLIQNNNLDKELEITVVATGFDNNNNFVISDTDFEASGALEIDLSETVQQTIVNPIANNINADLFNAQPVVPTPQPIIQETPRTVNLTDPSTPAYLRMGVTLESISTDVEMSNITLEDDQNKPGVRFKDNGNKYLHDNVD